MKLRGAESVPNTPDLMSLGQEMIDVLNLANEGRNTEIESARGVLREAQEVLLALQHEYGNSLHNALILRELKDAIGNLQQTIEGVD